jgi:hypothetical protein
MCGGLAKEYFLIINLVHAVGARLWVVHLITAMELLALTLFGTRFGMYMMANTTPVIHS